MMINDGSSHRWEIMQLYPLAGTTSDSNCAEVDLSLYRVQFIAVGCRCFLAWLRHQ